MLKVDHCGRYDEPPPMVRTLLSVDSATKTGAHNDFSVISWWGLSQSGGVFLLDVWRQRAEYPELKRALRSQYEQKRPDLVLVEDAASGVQIIQELRGEGLPLKPIKPVADKITRASPFSAGVESGVVNLPNRAPWLADVEAEMRAFPNGAHDDFVDTGSMAYTELKGTMQASNFRNPLTHRKRA